MPAYNFMGRFADAVERGTKCQTIRRTRTRPTRVGDTLYLYTGQRTKHCRQLAVVRCEAVTPITIADDGVWLHGEPLRYALCRLGDADLHLLAVRDGFATVEAFLSFFSKRYGLPTEGLELIEWLPPGTNVCLLTEKK